VIRTITLGPYALNFRIFQLLGVDECDQPLLFGNGIVRCQVIAHESGSGECAPRGGVGAGQIRSASPSFIR